MKRKGESLATIFKRAVEGQGYEVDLRQCRKISEDMKRERKWSQRTTNFNQMRKI